MKPDIYLYGMTVDSTIHRISGNFPVLDTYGELSGSWRVPGGEAMNAAMVLSRLGLTTALGGPWWGSESTSLLEHYAQRYKIDVSRITKVGDWPGVRDLVMVDDQHRTVFGRFAAYFSDPIQRWDQPDPEFCAQAGLVCIDPWFNADSELAARQCVAAGVPYVTIDCQPDSYLHRQSAANVVSGEYRGNHFAGRDEAELFAEYCATSSGLVVFSSGSRPIRFGRQGQTPALQEAFRVTAVSTLGAGDVFRAGIAFGLFKGLDDAATVRYAAGLAALCCTKMPIADTAPSLAELEAFLGV